MKAVYDYILSARQAGRKLLAVLFDPDKEPIVGHGLTQRVDAADVLLVGGSTAGGDARAQTERLVSRLKALTNKPVVLFPGQPEQFTPTADALLYLSVLTSRDVHTLTDIPIAAARAIHTSGMETIATGYVLIDGGKQSSVARASCSVPLAQTEPDAVADMALAACLMGKRLVYLEAGSGARVPVDERVIRTVRPLVAVPLIVGGGIRHPQQMVSAFRAGADIVVIGNHLEQQPDDASLFREQLQKLNND